MVSEITIASRTSIIVAKFTPTQALSSLLLVSNNLNGDCDNPDYGKVGQ
jgi:hypothetical protein